MPFGLTNVPATYQRLIPEFLGDLNGTICLVYLDDVIIFSENFEQHFARVNNTVLEKLKSCNLKLAPDNCHFFKPRIPFLGHIVSSENIETDPEKIAKVRNWPTPTSHDELRSFLAFAGNYRRFVKDYSRITRPLSALLSLPRRALSVLCQSGGGQALNKWYLISSSASCLSHLYWPTPILKFHSSSIQVPRLKHLVLCSIMSRMGLNV